MHLLLEAAAIKPEFFQLHAVVTGILRMSGQGEYIERIFREDEDVDPVISEKHRQMMNLMEEELRQQALLGVYEDDD
jgi:hypothetical protein